MAERPKPPSPNMPARPSISEQTEIGSDVPMEPLVSPEDVGIFTPAALQRYQMQAGSALLARGDRGPAVTELQRELRALDLLPLGEEFYEDGIYGDQTADAVRAFQDDHGLPPTGSCDVRTRQSIRESANDA
jgi:peptidoglycan hydrolase-like protein with peptidoglycan-binding domain